MRIAIVGVGAVGGTIGAHLARSGHETAFIARGDHLAAICSDGLTLETSQETFTVRPVLATADMTQAGVVDVVFLCVKAWALEDVAEAARAMIGQETVVVTIQNGVEAADVVAATVGQQRVVAGMCETLSEVLRPGVVRQVSRRPTLHLGERDGVVSPRVQRLRDLLSSKDLAVEAPADIVAALWRKLLLIAPFAGVGSLTRSPVGLWRDVAQSRKLAEELMAEVAAVASTRGVLLGPQALETTLRRINLLPADSKSSLQRDIEAGRRSELDAQIGAIPRIGGDAGVQTPAHDFLLAALGTGRAAEWAK